MRTREEILDQEYKDHAAADLEPILEVLLDIRDLLTPPEKPCPFCVAGATDHPHEFLNKIKKEPPTIK